MKALIPVLASTLALLGACIVDEWSDGPNAVTSNGISSKVPAIATTRSGPTSLPPDLDAASADSGYRSAKSDIKAFDGGSIKGTAVFTQRGPDVMVEIALSSCAEGSHVIQIFGGYSCDSLSSQGTVWSPPRGEHLGSDASTIRCGADKKGSLTFTRRGSDPAASWTVGDQNAATDVTREIIVVFAADDPTRRQACGAFL